MRDADVRQVLRNRLEMTHAADEGARVVEELGLCKGTVRADIAVVNGILKGYEIKSKQDTLVRLKTQASVYSQVFDTVTLVLAERHLIKAKSLVPSWWGIEVAFLDVSSSAVKLSPVREEQMNPCVDALTLVQLLWRDEVLSILANVLDHQSFSKKPRTFLWEHLAQSMPLCDLKTVVRMSLKTRTGWRVDEQRKPNDVTFRLSSMSSNSRDLPFRPRNRRYTHRPN
jgi:hypothetical protein